MLAKIQTPLVDINQASNERRVNFSAYFLPFTFEEVASRVFPISERTAQEELIRFKFLHLRDCYELIGQISLAMANLAIYQAENSGLQREIFEGATRIPIDNSSQGRIISRNPPLKSVKVGMCCIDPCPDIQTLARYLHPENALAPTTSRGANRLPNSYEFSICESRFKFDPFFESMFDPTFVALHSLFPNEKSLSARMPCYFEMRSEDNNHIPALRYIIQELDKQIPHYDYTCRRGGGLNVRLFNSRLYFTGKAALPEHVGEQPSMLPTEFTRRLSE